MRMMMRFGLLLAMVGFLTFLSTPAQAQIDDDPLMERGSLSLYAGGYTPSGTIGGGEFDDDAAVGAALGVWLTQHVGIRANGLYAQPGVEGDPAIDLNAPNIWMYSGDLVLRNPMQLGSGVLAPYVLGGLGAKTYDFENLDSETDFAGNFGAGLEYQFPREHAWGLLVEVRDFVSQFEVGPVDDVQHDILRTGGVRLGF